jgi:hypothetical protein
VVLRRERFIRSFTLPHGLFDNLIKRHPGLSLKQCQLVAHGLRQFFLAYLKGGRKFVSMPSQIADDLWHEFILFTRNYDAFCRQAFGGFLHHTPAVVLSSLRQSNAGLRRCWWHVCLDENINPKAPTRLPLLFALDAKLNVPNGFYYAADCNAVRRTNDGRAASGVVYWRRLLERRFRRWHRRAGRLRRWWRQWRRLRGRWLRRRLGRDGCVETQRGSLTQLAPPAGRRPLFRVQSVRPRAATDSARWARSMAGCDSA